MQLLNETIDFNDHAVSIYEDMIDKELVTIVSLIRKRKTLHSYLIRKDEHVEPIVSFWMYPFNPTKDSIN